MLSDTVMSDHQVMQILGLNSRKKVFNNQKIITEFYFVGLLQTLFLQFLISVNTIQYNAGVSPVPNCPPHCSKCNSAACEQNKQSQFLSPVRTENRCSNTFNNDVLLQPGLIDIYYSRWKQVSVPVSFHYLSNSSFRMLEFLGMDPQY